MNKWTEYTLVLVGGAVVSTICNQIAGIKFENFGQQMLVQIPYMVWGYWLFSCANRKDK